MVALKINRPNEIAVRDRRAGRDRRTSPRFAVNIEILWESLGGEHGGTISDISTRGCFVLCSGEVEDGETAKITIPLMNGEKIQLWGEIVNHVYEMGFGLRFVELGDKERLFLERLCHKLKHRSETNRKIRR
ncbi:MAG: PilZ domain-containing protein [Acidobacteriota bacterium]|nr:PilZ domain-containing protein [Acidobacteriota bacterium]